MLTLTLPLVLQMGTTILDSEVMREIYSNRPPHYQFIGEIMEVLDKR